MSLLGFLHRGIQTVFSQNVHNGELIVNDKNGNRFALPIVGESEKYDKTPEGGHKRIGQGYYQVDTDRGRVVHDVSGQHTGDSFDINTVWHQE